MGNTSSLIVQQIVSQALTAEELKTIPEGWWEKSTLSEGALQKLVGHWQKLVTRFGGVGYTWEEALLVKGLTAETVDDFFVQASLKSEMKNQWKAHFSWSSTLEEVLQSEVIELPAYFKTLKPPHWLGDQWSHLSPPLIVEMVWPWLSYLEESLEALFQEAGVSFPEGWLSYAYGVLAFSSAPLYAQFYNRWSSLSPDIEEYELEKEVLNALSSKGMHESLWKQYPVWARVLATQTRQLLAMARQLLNHWSEDQAALIAEGWITEGVAWKRVEPGYSDPHEGGATAVIIIFEDDRKLVYKPRHLALEAQYVDLTRFLREEWEDCGLSACRAMDGGDHGWMPFLAKEAPHFANELAPYHQHLGQLNALAYFLGASDLHPGNIIPQGIHPVPIDWECLLAPTESNEGFTLENTCLFTGLSPSWSVSLDRSHAYYSYGLAEGPRKWVNPLPQFVKQRQGKKWKINYLEVKGFDRRQMWMLRHPQRHLDSFLEGFERMYRWLLDHRGNPAWEKRFWSVFTPAQSRYVVRPTQLYRDALFYSLMPLHLSSGLQYGVALERAMISVPVSLDDDNNLVVSRVMAYEKSQLVQRDVPIFYGDTNGTAIYFGNGEKATASIAKSPKAMAQQRLAKASDSQMRWQINCLESLYASIRISKEERRMIPTDARYLVLHIAKAVESLHIDHPEGVRWPDWFPNGKNGTSLQTVIAPSSLHEGVDGNALFLIQAGHCFNNPSWLSLGKQALDYGRVEALKLLEGSEQGLSPCAFTGVVFSSIYAHAYGYLQTEDATLKEKLQYLLKVLKGSNLEQFDITRHDYIGGLSSGLMLLSRLAIHPAFSEHRPWLKEWIEQWAFALVELSKGLEETKPSMAHGRAGWYLALHTAQKVICVQEFETLLETWRELLVVALPEVQKQTHVSKTWWCAGLPGIVQALAVTADKEIAQAAALQWISVVEEMPVGALDHLCCGEAGRVYAVNTALRQLNRAPQIKSDHLLKRFSRHGQWQYQLFREGSIIPGAMVGAPGIGLALLQSLFPDKNPCIFTLEM